jgi:hypothetical protein
MRMVPTTVNLIEHCNRLLIGADGISDTPCMMQNMSHTYDMVMHLKVLVTLPSTWHCTIAFQAYSQCNTVIISSSSAMHDYNLDQITNVVLLNIQTKWYDIR